MGKGWSKPRAKRWLCRVLVVTATALGSFFLMGWSWFSLPNEASAITTIKCAQHDGVIVANMHGRLGNNLFQIAMANRLSQDLCWPIVYKEGWQGEVFPHNPRALHCFPNTKIDDSTPTPERIDRWFQGMKINDITNQTWRTPKEFLEQLPYKEHDQIYQQWWKHSQQEGTLLRISSPWEFDYSSPSGWDNELVDRLKNPGDHTFITKLKEPKTKPYYSVRTVLMDAYYIHYGWIQPRLESIQIWLAMNEEACCRHIPPPNAVVIHIRNFMYWENLNPDFKIDVYIQLLDRYYFGMGDISNPQDQYELWIVCQPGETHIALVQTLKNRYNGTIVTGDDPYDAFCTLQKAQHLVISTHSTFSQMAALLGNNQKEVHYLLPTLQYPKVTLVVPDWTYHLVEPVKKNTIQTWNVPVNSIQGIMS